MKRIIPVIFALPGFAGCASSAGHNSYRQVTAYEAADIMALEEDCVILDVRTQAEYDEGHIPGAICIPNESIGTVSLEPLGDKDTLILVYCRSGNRSKQAAAKLAELGYTNVVEFGGIMDWPGEVQVS